MINSFNEYLTMAKSVFMVVSEIAKYKGIEIEAVRERIEDPTHGGIIQFTVSTDGKMSKLAQDVVKQLRHNPDLIELYLMTRIAKEGPKIFRPTQLQFTMLEQMTLNIECSEYVQPFNTIIIELPKNYSKNKNVILPQAGETIHKEDGPLPETHQPVFVIINHHKELNVITCSVMFSSGLSTKMAMVMRKDAMLEEYMIKLDREREVYAGSLPTSPGEEAVQISCIKSALNYCLLLDEIGIKNIGKSNDKYHQRLIKYRDNENNPDRIRKLTSEIRLMPTLYELDQEVKLFSTVNNTGDLPEYQHNTGRRQSPHHRKGYYRQQPHGPKNSLRKRIRINPVFVNSTLFLGDMINARATYNG